MSRQLSYCLMSIFEAQGSQNESMTEQQRNKLRLSLLALLWGIAVLVGFSTLIEHECTPGQAAVAPDFWPSESKVPVSNSVPTLLMVIHPQCPCTRASLGELAKLMTSSQGKVNAHVLLYSPVSPPDHWEHTDLEALAQAIPGVTLHRDLGGEEAQRFGVATSGQVLLYKSCGELTYAGGVTVSRGHAGDSKGLLVLKDLILKKSNRPGGTTSVYGCEMQRDEILCRPNN